MNTLEQLQKTLDTLSDDEKLNLAKWLICRVRGSHPDTETAWANEVAERRAAYLRGELPTRDAHEFLRELRSR